MNLLARCLLLTLALTAPLAAYAKPPAAAAKSPVAAKKPPATPAAPAEPPAPATTSMLRVVCEGDDAGAEVLVNGKFKGECPVDFKVRAGTLKLRVQKKVDAFIERVFEQEFRIAEDSVKKIEVVLSAQLSADGQAELKMQGIEPGKGFKDCPDCPEMVMIPPGNFEMGSNNGTFTGKPVHRVSINRAFALGKTEVTQGQWKALMGNNPSNFQKCSDNSSTCGDRNPVESVTWDDAQAFISKLNAKTGKQYRLPSEAEWEYACHAGGQHEYCGSDDIDSVAWYGNGRQPGGNSGQTTHPVAQKQANAFGLYDMSGNVWEWTADSFHDTYNGAPSDGTEWQGDGAKRVVRGGDWRDDPEVGRVAFRNWGAPKHLGYFYGFRLARTLP